MSSWSKLDDIWGRPQQDAPTVVVTAPKRETPWTPPSVAQVKNPPPLPVVVENPPVTPVAKVKNDTAMYNQYTPEAARTLFKTPVQIHFGPYESDPYNKWYPGSSGSEGLGGFYHGKQVSTFEDGAHNPNSDYEIRVNGGWTPTADDDPYRYVLSHEFAHKWYDKGIAPVTRDSWNWIAPDKASYFAKERLAEGVKEGHYTNALDPDELYAYNAERGPGYIKAEDRAAYYPGLYQDNIRPPAVQGTYALRPDEAPISYSPRPLRLAGLPVMNHRYDVPGPDQISPEVWRNGMKLPDYPYAWQVNADSSAPSLGDIAAWYGVRLK